MIDEYYNKFGKLFFFYYQNTELKVISDGKIIHEILVKRFDKWYWSNVFCNRKVSSGDVLEPRQAFMKVYFAKIINDQNL